MSITLIINFLYLVSKVALNYETSAEQTCPFLTKYMYLNTKTKFNIVNYEA